MRLRWLIPAVVRARTVRRASVLGSTLLVTLCAAAGAWDVAGAVFARTTGNGPTSYAAGTVVLTNSAAGVALFNVTALQPGSLPATQCLTVSYSGSLAAAVKVRAAITGGLGAFLTVTLERGTGTCAAFGASTQLYSGLASTLASTNATYATGLGSWAVAGGSTTTQPFRLTYQLANTNSAQGLSSNLTLTWEAQNT